MLLKKTVEGFNTVQTSMKRAAFLGGETKVACAQCHFRVVAGATDRGLVTRTGKPSNDSCRRCLATRKC